MEFSPNNCAPVHFETVIMLGTSLNTKGGIASVERVLLERWVSPYLRVIHIQTHLDGSVWVKLRCIFSSLLQFIWILMSRKVSLIYIHFASRASFYRKSLFILVARFFAKPLVGHAHGAEFWDFYIRESGRTKRWYIRRILACYERLIVLSEEWRSLYGQIFKGLIEIVHNPVCLPPYATAARERPPVLLSLGQLGWRKGTYDILAAIPAVLARHADTQFWLGGDGEVEEVARRLGSAPWRGQVHLLGWIAGKEKCAALQKAWIFLLPSYKEGLPMAILEAMAYAVPVVTTPVGGIPSAVQDGENGILIEPGDVDGLASAINRLLDDARLRIRLGEQGRRLAKERFDADLIVRRVEDICVEIIFGRKLPPIP